MNIILLQSFARIFSQVEQRESVHHVFITKSKRCFNDFPDYVLSVFRRDTYVLSVFRRGMRDSRLPSSLKRLRTLRSEVRECWVFQPALRENVPCISPLAASGISWSKEFGYIRFETYAAAHEQTVRRIRSSNKRRARSAVAFEKGDQPEVGREKAQTSWRKAPATVWPKPTLSAFPRELPRRMTTRR